MILHMTTEAGQSVTVEVPNGANVWLDTEDGDTIGSLYLSQDGATLGLGRYTVAAGGWDYAETIPTTPEAEAAERIAAGVRDGNLSWGDVAEQSARGWCPASPEGTEPHIVTDGRTCDECGADAEPYTLHYISADAPGDEATWSVYRERYISRDHDEPIDGSQEHISTHATEAEADAEARRLQLSA